MKRVTRGLAVALLLCILTVLPAWAEDTLVFERGKQLILFEQDGVKLTLSGEVEDNGSMFLQLMGVLENKTNHKLSVLYNGTCNGWTVANSFLGGSGSEIQPNSKTKTYIWLLYDQLEIGRFADLQEANLSFAISDSESGDTVTTVENVHIAFSSANSVQLTYFEECPSLPNPLFCGSMYESSHSGAMKVNGVATSNAVYLYTGRELDRALSEYVQKLKELGFTVSGSKQTYTISKNAKKLAMVSMSGSNLKVEILPGNEQSASNVSKSYTKKKMGDTLKTSAAQMKLTKSGVTDRVYSYDGAQPSYFFYYDPQPGNRYLYLKGTFKNTLGREVDIRNIYAQVVMDGNTYEGTVQALRPDGKNFENYVAAQAEMGCYVLFEIPSVVINRYKSAVVTLGFTSDFGIKIRNARTGYDFDRCEGVFEIDVSPASSTGKPSSSKQTEGTSAQKPTAVPAAEASSKRGAILFQEIPWNSTPEAARKILYDKGYVSSKSVAYFDYSVACMLSDTKDRFYELTSPYEKVLYGDVAFYDENKKKIAGYDVDTMALCYAYGVKNGKLDKKTRKLISVNIELSAPDVEAAQTDLLAKLTKVYGRPDIEKYGSYVWQGADGSMLLLYDFGCPSLLYSQGDNTALVQQMYAELGYTADENDVDGL